jgi:hypothetical protein
VIDHSRKPLPELNALVLVVDERRVCRLVCHDPLLPSTLSLEVERAHELHGESVGGVGDSSEVERLLEVERLRVPPHVRQVANEWSSALVSMLVSSSQASARGQQRSGLL